LEDVTSSIVPPSEPFCLPAQGGTFVDLYAGCAGLSLGLMLSGWRGLFAVERDANAFQTLKHNLIDGPHGVNYNWPNWLPKKQTTIGAFINRYSDELLELRGQVDLIVGGPPCQGFSMAGRRKKNDPRNTMFRHYVKIVELIRPTLLLLENVKGIDIEFGKEEKARAKVKQTKRRRGRPPLTFAARIQRALDKAGYKVFVRLVKALDHGVPQTRPRYFVFAISKAHLVNVDESLLAEDGALNPFTLLAALRTPFLLQKGLATDKPITVQNAISDLETSNKEVIDCEDSPGFNQIRYEKPLTAYQHLMHGTMNGTSPNSMRLVNHRPDTVTRFQLILDTCRRGVCLSKEDRKRLGMKKYATVPLDFAQPSHTLTTLPDDLIHYSEPRILTVRESARLQSFPDWYEFKGVYTTGGKQRVRQCPRYTQVGNAVPPLLAELIGWVFWIIHEVLQVLNSTSITLPQAA
jgi:DNA (cytosine-5)-methyltransferase 1